MKGLSTLIKLHKRTLDDLRRKMGGLENQKSQLLQVIAALKQELADEMKTAGKQPEMAHFFGDFARRIKNRQDQVHAEIKSLEAQIAKLNDKIAEEFSELKKYEIAKANAEKRAALDKKHKDTSRMDEIAERQYRQKNEDA